VQVNDKLPRYLYQERDMTRVLVLELREPASAEMTQVDVECVVDIDDFDEVAGIEILDLGSQMGLPATACVDAVNTPQVRVAYDESVDAMYIKLGRVRAQHQIVAQAHLFLDAKTTLVRMEVPLHR
jgi:uncharacterized protein YuzE